MENRVFSVKFELNPTAQNFRPPGLVDSGPPSSADMSPKIEEDDDSDEDEVLLRDVSGAHLLEESDYHDDCEC